MADAGADDGDVKGILGEWARSIPEQAEDEETEANIHAPLRYTDHDDVMRLDRFLAKRVSLEIGYALRGQHDEGGLARLSIARGFAERVVVAPTRRAEWMRCFTLTYAVLHQFFTRQRPGDEPPAKRSSRSTSGRIAVFPDANVMVMLTERMERAASGVVVRRTANPHVVVVQRPAAESSHRLLLGVHRPALYDMSNVEMVSVRVKGTRFLLQAGSVYMDTCDAEGLVPIGCTCGDWVHRSHYAAVLGCKHMVATYGRLPHLPPWSSGRPARHAKDPQ